MTRREVLNELMSRNVFVCMGFGTLLIPAAREFGADATAHRTLPLPPIGRDDTTSKNACDRHY